ncbi:RNA polymerase sigma factor FliA [Kosakonia sacchari]|uniref:RNA polymerase sigma factor for flagellar operon FliA n=1 Tax=Kosakonia sacchari TaxID=1158459 RepID=A0A1G4YVJ0_9ENTR|nr:RNA polymerase sigma factor FliA [Kosakonia sacchari]AHJ76969.1 RNA polymerase sigma factor FliA [Kosakonia sacchari SP1]MDN2485618.1 RNA polymerase sigma factor FliA [Kosakonia sacchari]NUL38048.1 RNA polymerase sigma factor FliA [Kosakonia sacchari]SCX57489.1 RNA polymerase sigma factor for flagellar operon FliA [Kosakonia sacchari]
MNGLYSPDGSIQKDQLWTKYGYLVRYEALKMQSKLSSSVDIDDLIQAGAIALLDAIEQFDPKKGVKLTVYIAQRLRWAFMDELREHDWVPRRVRRKTREVSSAIMRVEQRAGGVASESDIAAELGMSLQEYQQVLSDTNTSMLCSLDELQELLADGVELSEMEQDHLDPLNDVLLGDLTKQISKEIRELPEREQMLLNLYYQQELNMKEVGSLLGITETRVSQLHSQTIKRLRARLEGRGWE